MMNCVVARRILVAVVAVDRKAWPVLGGNDENIPVIYGSCCALKSKWETLGMMEDPQFWGWVEWDVSFSTTRIWSVYGTRAAQEITLSNMISISSI